MSESCLVLFKGRLSGVLMLDSLECPASSSTLLSGVILDGEGIPILMPCSQDAASFEAAHA